MKLFVKEIQLHAPYRHTRRWVVELDNTDGWDYRARTSANAFFYSPKRRNYTNDFVYTSRPVEEAVLMEKINPDNEQQIASLWDFYNIIGYNHSRKKIYT